MLSNCPPPCQEGAYKSEELGERYRIAKGQAQRQCVETALKHGVNECPPPPRLELKGRSNKQRVHRKGLGQGQGGTGGRVKRAEEASTAYSRCP